MVSLTMFCAKGIWENWMVDAMSSASNFFGSQLCLLFSLGAFRGPGMCGSVLDLEWNSKSRTWCSLLLEMYQWGLYGAKSLWLFVYYTKLKEWIGIIYTHNNHYTKLCTSWQESWQSTSLSMCHSLNLGF